MQIRRSIISPFITRNTNDVKALCGWKIIPVRPPYKTRSFYWHKWKFKTSWFHLKLQQMAYAVIHMIMRRWYGRKLETKFQCYHKLIPTVSWQRLYIHPFSLMTTNWRCCMGWNVAKHVWNVGFNCDTNIFF